jgi:hypothetical protein
MKQTFLKSYAAKGLTYTAYRELINNLLQQNSVTGTEQSKSLVEYSKLNVARMNRIDKTFEAIPELQQIIAGLPDKMVWLVITEGWCGDAAQSTPVFNALASFSNNIELKFLLRDEHPELMDMYLTGKSRSIPKLIMLCADSYTELAVWGPRPQASQSLLNQLRAQGVPFEEMVEELYRWYAQDKTQSIQAELFQILENILIARENA